MTHDYTAEEALALILTSLERSNAALAERAQVAIDAGIDDVLEQDVVGAKKRRGKGSKREYRKNRPLTDQESIDVVLEVLEAHLVVHRQVINTVTKEFKESALGSVKEHAWSETSAKELVIELAETIDTEKDVLIELMPESARLASDQEQTVELRPVLATEITELEALIEAVRTLTRFRD